MELIKAQDLKFDPRPQMGAIFVEGFYQWLKYFSKDKRKLASAFSHSFQLDGFYVALISDEVVAMAGCSNKGGPVLKLEQKQLRKHLGMVSGTLAYLMLKKGMTKKPYPFAMELGMGSVDFVATAQKYRGQGIGYRLIGFAMRDAGHIGYVLEVASNNASAIRLYEKLGFKEFLRVPEKHPKQAGFDEYIYMTKG
ncbi:MAG: GNAT family N-acetyltransferase [Turicibacter sp.]|nr:GNAT family N-acetyltransferase [Turicibacter sp.]